MQIARLAGACDFFTGLGDDELGHARRGARRRAASPCTRSGSAPTRRALTHVDRNGERTITTIGPKLLPRGPLPLDGVDAVFFVAGDADALRAARAARFLAATTRELPTLLEAGVHLDLLVGSGNDPGEAYDGGLDADVVVMTDGARGCVANGRHFDAAPLPGPIADTYGAGDTFGCRALLRARARGRAGGRTRARGARVGRGADAPRAVSPAAG